MLQQRVAARGCVWRGCAPPSFVRVMEAQKHQQGGEACWRTGLGLSVPEREPGVTGAKLRR
jgi:hypothetical protein